MGRLTIYLDDEIEKRMTASAKAMKLSKSKWIANAIREKLAGSWVDFPTLEEIRAADQRDITREGL